MRHQKKGHKLGRTKAHRKATLANLGSALIEHKRITTTLPKAKALRPFVEPLITRSKDDTTHNRRQVFRHLRDKNAVDELFYEVAEEVGDRPGGYTRIIKLGRRQGDGAEMAMVELVDYNDVKPETGSGGRKRTRRGSGKGRRRRSKSRKEQPQEAQQEESQQEEAAAQEAAAEAPEAQQQALSAEDLTEIDGIGPATAKKLLNHFESVEAVIAADPDELEEIVGPSITEKLVSHFGGAGEEEGEEEKE